MYDKSYHRSSLSLTGLPSFHSSLAFVRSILLTNSFLSVYLLSVFVYLSICPFVCPSVTFYLSVCLPACLPRLLAYLPVFLSVCPLQGFLCNERENTLLAAIEQSRKNVSHFSLIINYLCLHVHVYNYAEFLSADICRGREGSPGVHTEEVGG